MLPVSNSARTLHKKQPNPQVHDVLPVFSIFVRERHRLKLFLLRTVQ
jgi:hypothetical protein